MIDYTKLARFLSQLELQHKNFQQSSRRPELTQLDREALAESVIQRFETCYDTLWKTLKRYLVVHLGLSEVPNSPKPIIRLAHENNLLPSPVETWLSYADARTSTAHDYSGEKAAECLKVIGPFISDAARLYTSLSFNEWNQQAP